MSKTSRYCCVANCLSKSPGCVPNKRTIFRVPKDERREKWLEVLSSHLRQGKHNRKQLYVCELHFQPEDVLRNSILMYCDGTTQEIPRQSIRLKSSSVPSIFNTTAQSEMYEVISQSELSVEQHEYTMESEEDQSVLQREVPAEQNHDTLQEEVSVKLECQDTLYDLHALTIDVANSKFSQNEGALQREMSTEQNHKILPEEVSFKLEYQDTSYDLRALTIDVANSKLLQNEGALQREVSAEQNHETLSEEVSVKHECQDTSYSLHALTIDVANSNLSHNERAWVFSIMRTGICWYYVADDYPNVTRSIFIKDDMTVEVRARGRIIQFDDFNHIGCFEDLLCIMTAIGGLTLCRGVDDSLPCPSGFAKPNSSRCDVCRIEQRRKKSRESKKAKRAIARKAKTHKFVKNLKRKYKRLQSNYIIAKEHLENLKLRCSEV